LRRRQNGAVTGPGVSLSDPATRFSSGSHASLQVKALLRHATRHDPLGQFGTHIGSALATFGLWRLLRGIPARRVHRAARSAPIQWLGLTAVIIPVLTQHYAMLQWVGQKRLSQSLCVTCRGGGVGRN
jgi:hypothetical protein